MRGTSPRGVNFREFYKGELRRITLPRTPLNRSSLDAPGFAAWDDGRERVKPLQRREVYAAVAEVELARDALIVHVRGMDRLWDLREADWRYPSPTC